MIGILKRLLNLTQATYFQNLICLKTKPLKSIRNYVAEATKTLKNDYSVKSDQIDWIPNQFWNFINFKSSNFYFPNILLKFLNPPFFFSFSDFFSFEFFFELYETVCYSSQTRIRCNFHTCLKVYFNFVSIRFHGYICFLKYTMRQQKKLIFRKEIKT